MARPLQAEGFTLLEMMMVLLICAILAVLAIPNRTSHLEAFMGRLEAKLVKTQLEAYVTKEKQHVEIRETEAQIGNTSFPYPEGTACSPYAWDYTADGTVTLAGTITCTDGIRTESLVIRIGAGRIRHGT